MVRAVTTATSAEWTPEALKDHLQAAVYLELWTIPMYMTALYSIQVPGVSGTPTPTPVGQKPASDEQRAFDIVFSVFTQEMLHLQLACNIYSALFYRTDSPKLTGAWAPSYQSGIPFIESMTSAQLGGADRIRARLFLEIERPESRDAVTPTAPQALYDTIGEFYNAVEYGIGLLFDQLYDPTASADDMRQKTVFSSLYPTIPQAISGNNAEAKAILDRMVGAIVDQGEGAKGPFVAADDQPADDAKLDKLSHFARFRWLRRLVRKGIQTYPLSHHTEVGEDGSDDLFVAQSSLNSALTSFLASLERDFGTAGPEVNLTSMSGFAGKTAGVWKAGGIPEMDATSAQSQDGLVEMHICQGLNTCEGHGKDGSGTKAGDGACATAIDHQCGGTNDCRIQGGCGYTTQDRSDPGDNYCKGAGGCGSPIPPDQVFHDGPYQGAKVWDKARELFTTRLASVGIVDIAPPPTEPSKYRKNLSPT